MSPLTFCQQLTLLFRAEIFYDLYEKYDGAINIWCMDHCSQGISGRWAADEAYSDRGWTADFRNYAKDQVYFINNVANLTSSKSPRYLFCHSMGGLVGTQIVATLPGFFSKVILSAPMFTVKGLDGVPFAILRYVAYTVDKILGKGKEWVPGAATKPDHRCPEPPENETSACIDR
jgi:lysophospholipase